MYNLGAMSHVKVSFDLAEYTADVDGVGTLRLLDAIRTCGMSDKIRFYQASTSEMFGKVRTASYFVHLVCILHNIHFYYNLLAKCCFLPIVLFFIRQ